MLEQAEVIPKGPEAYHVDEAKEIRDEALVVAAYARQAQDRSS